MLRVVSKLGDMLKEKNITQKELSEMIDIRPSDISDMVNLKRTSVNLSRIEKIAKVLDIEDITNIIDFSEIYYIKSICDGVWYEVVGVENGYIRCKVDEMWGTTIEAIEYRKSKNCFYHSTFNFDEISIYEIVSKFNRLAIHGRAFELNSALSVEGVPKDVLESESRVEMYILYSMVAGINPSRKKIDIKNPEELFNPNIYEIPWR